MSSADEGEEDDEGEDGIEENETPAKKVITGDNINPYSAGVPLMGRFKNQTQPNVIIDIYF